MSNRNKILYGILLLVVLIFGFTVGHLWKDLPGVKFNAEVKLYEVFNLLLTLAIGIIIPLLVKKWIEDNRSIKSCLVDEIKTIIITLDRVKDIIARCHTDGSITKEHKDEINFLFHKAELQITSLNEQMKISFEPHCKKIIDQLKEKYHTYKDYLTGGELMLSAFTRIDIRFYREHSTEHSRIETHLKTIIHKIHKI